MERHKQRYYEVSRHPYEGWVLLTIVAHGLEVIIALVIGTNACSPTLVREGRQRPLTKSVTFRAGWQKQAQ